MHDDQLSKASLKATAETLRHLESQHAKISSTIDVLRGILRNAGMLSSNGHSGPAVNVPATEHTDADVERIVTKARGKFAARKSTRRRAARRTPADWQKDIVKVLHDADKPLSGIEIGAAFGMKSLTFYKHIKAALKQRHIVSVGTTTATNGRKVPSYVLAGQGKAAKKATKTPAKKKSGFAKKILAQRERSAALLAEFDLNTPTRPSRSNRSMGSLVRRGYLRRVGSKEYVRTGKVYEVNA